MAKQKKETDAPFDEVIVESKVTEKVKNEDDGSKGEAKELTSLPPEYLQIIKDLQEQVASLAENQKVLASKEEDENFDARQDYLDVPATFFAFSSRFAIFGDKRFGREVLPPRDEYIIFEKLHRYARQATTGRGMEMVSVCQATVRSKETAKYLRDHNLYGIKFFESIKKAQSVNVTLAEKMAEMHSVIGNMNDYQIIERAKREGIVIADGDVRQLRKELCEVMAKAAIKKQDHIHKLNFSGERDEEGRKVEWKKVVETDADLKQSEKY